MTCVRGGVEYIGKNLEHKASTGSVGAPRSEVAELEDRRRGGSRVRRYSIGAGPQLLTRPFQTQVLATKFPTVLITKSVKYTFRRVARVVVVMLVRAYTQES